MNKTIFYILIVFVLLGCKTARHISNGDAMMVQQNFERAAREYRSALRNSPNNPKAFAGLQSASDQYIKEQLKRFDDLFKNRQYVQAADVLTSALEFKDSYSISGIKINIPASYISTYRDITNAEAEYYYRLGRQEMDKHNFSQAIRNFKKVQETSPSYKDVRSLLNQAEQGASLIRAEELYQRGVSSYQAGNYRRAYNDFDSSLKQVSGYKNAAEFRASALERGKVRIGIFDFGNNTSVHGAQATLTSYVINNIVRNKSPFIDVVDRQNLDRLLNEINFSYSGSVDLSTAARAGKQLGLNYVIVGQLTNIVSEGGEILPQQVNVYELYHVTIDDKRVPRGRPVSFMLYEGSTRIRFETQYQIVSVETGQIVKSNIVSAQEDDAVRFARYQGNPSLLYITDPGLAAGGEGIAGFITAALVTATRVDQSLFAARRTLKTPSQLQADIMKDIGRQISREIIREFD